MGRAPQPPQFFDAEADNYVQLLLSENTEANCNAIIIFTAQVSTEVQADIQYITNTDKCFVVTPYFLVQAVPWSSTQSYLESYARVLVDSLSSGHHAIMR